MTSPIRIAVILENDAGELDRQEHTFDDDDDDIEPQVNLWATNVIEGWALRLGDTIRLVEVPA